MVVFILAFAFVGIAQSAVMYPPDDHTWWNPITSYSSPDWIPMVTRQVSPVDASDPDIHRIHDLIHDTLTVAYTGIKADVLRDAVVNVSQEAARYLRIHKAEVDWPLIRDSILKAVSVINAHGVLNSDLSLWGQLGSGLIQPSSNAKDLPATLGAINLVSYMIVSEITEDDKIITYSVVSP